jgi:hypothetical protein
VGIRAALPIRESPQLLFRQPHLKQRGRPKVPAAARDVSRRFVPVVGEEETAYDGRVRGSELVARKATREAIMIARALVVFLLVVATAMASESEKRRSRASIVKVYVAKAKKTDCLGHIDVDVDSDGEKLSFNITAKTKLERVVGGKTRPCKLADLKKGQKVEVEHSGIFAATVPLTTAAIRIVVLERTK